MAQDLPNLPITCPRCDKDNATNFLNEFSKARDYNCYNCEGFFFTLYKDEKLDFVKFHLGDKRLYVNFFHNETTLWKRSKKIQTFRFADKSLIKKSFNELEEWLNMIVIFQ